jgi:hypothetical protein
LEIDGTKYTDFKLSSFNGVSVGIEHSSGVAEIPAIKLKPDQIAALNATSSSVRIDPSRIVTGTPTPAGRPSVAIKTENRGAGAGESSDTGKESIPQGQTASQSQVSQQKGGTQEGPSGLPKLGATKSDFVNHYGKPLEDKRVDNNETMDQWLIFFKNGFSIDVFLLHDKAQVIKFIKRPLSEEEAGIILGNNSEGQNWMKNEDPLTMKDWQFVRSDGNAYAFVAIRDMEYNLRNHREDEIGIVAKYVVDIQAAKNRKAIESSQVAEEKRKQSEAARREELRKKAAGL